jgi:hypothetical protein
LRGDPSLIEENKPRQFQGSAELSDDGTVTVLYPFPQAGRYVVHLDFAVRSQEFAQEFPVTVAGYQGSNAPALAEELEKEVDGYRVRLNPISLKVGTPSVVQVHIERNDERVTNLQPYLAAPMHVAVVSQDLRTVIHTHGELPQSLWDRIVRPRRADGKHAHVMLPEQFASPLDVPVVFPRPGSYAFIVQFQRGGRVITVPFTVVVDQ